MFRRERQKTSVSTVYSTVEEDCTYNQHVVGQGTVCVEINKHSSEHCQVAKTNQFFRFM